MNFNKEEFDNLIKMISSTDVDNVKLALEILGDHMDDDRQFIYSQINFELYVNEIYFGVEKSRYYKISEKIINSLIAYYNPKI